MSDNNLRQLLVYAAILGVVAYLGARWLGRDEGRSGAADAPAAAIEVREHDRGAVTVHVAGAVRRPGVYRLAPGSRVNQAVRRAGGATGRADTTQINLAAKVEDGRQVLVPELPPEPGADRTTATAATGGPAAAGLPVNLNTATLEQLDALEGIGPATAQQILDFRDANDGFGSIEELGDVPGIGDKRLATLREKVRL